MRLKILLPNKVLIDESAAKIIAEAENGAFCLEPRHVDFVSALTAGLLTYINAEGDEMYVGIDEGILVKCGREVRISTREAVTGTDPAALRLALIRHNAEAYEHERSARSVLARLEAGLAKRFLELQKGR